VFWCISRTIRCVSTWLKGYKAAVQASSGVVIQVVLYSRHQKPSASSMAYPCRSRYHASRCLCEDQGDFRRCGRPMPNTRRYGNVHFQDSRFKTYLPASVVAVIGEPQVACFHVSTYPVMAGIRMRVHPKWRQHVEEEVTNCTRSPGLGIA
jgi:hypothetical protein